MAAKISRKQLDHWTVKDMNKYSWLLGHPVIAGEYVCFVRQRSGAFAIQIVKSSCSGCEMVYTLKNGGAEIPADAIAGYMIF